MQTDCKTNLNVLHHLNKGITVVGYAQVLIPEMCVCVKCTLKN